MKGNSMKALLVCTIVYAATITVHAFVPGTRYRYFPDIYQNIEQDFNSPDVTGDIIWNFFMLADLDAPNLASEGDREALDWVRKCIERFYPQRESLVFKHETIGHNVNGAWAQIFTYLAIKGDGRDIALVSQYGNDELNALLKMRVAGVNAFDYDSSNLATTFINQLFQMCTFFPSVANTGPQAVYVREILYRYWEEHGRDSSTMPQELLTMVVSFDEDGNLVCSVDLAKYGLSMPIITPRPDREDFSLWNGELYGGIPTTLTVEFPDLAEPVELKPYMIARVQKSPDWEGLYAPIPKKPVTATECTPSAPAADPPPVITSEAKQPPSAAQPAMRQPGAYNAEQHGAHRRWLYAVPLTVIALVGILLSRRKK